MKTKKILTLLFIWLGIVSFSSAYNLEVWNPIQYIKKLYVTSDGSMDPSKSTIILN